MTTPTGQGRVGERPGSVRQPQPSVAAGGPPQRPTPWLGAVGSGVDTGSVVGGARRGPDNGTRNGMHSGPGGGPHGGDTEWFANDPPTQPLPAIREPRAPREGAHAQPPVPAAQAARQAPPLRDVPVRDIARAQQPAPPAGAVSAAASPTSIADTPASPAPGSANPRDDASWSPPRPRGPRTIPAPVRASFRWWLVAALLAVTAMTLSVVLAVMYAGRYGTTAAGGATVGSILFEILVLGGAGFVVARMRSGDDWARTLLAGGGGLMALIVALNTAGQFSFGSSMVAGFTTAVATVRLFEAASAAVAIWYMFQPGAGRHFDPRGREE